MFKKILLLILILAISSPEMLCSAGAAPNSYLTISAAMSLKRAFEEIGAICEQKFPGVKVLFNFGASGMLEKQIESGAPVDIFASASLREMDELEAKGLLIKNTKRTFAGNSLVLVVPSNSKLKVKSCGDLANDSVKRIAIGNPKSVPAGKYSEETLKNLHLLERLKEKLVYAENVRQVMDYVSRGEVDAGLVFFSDTFTRMSGFKMAGKVPDGSHEEINYPIAVVRGTANESLARLFIQTVISKKGKEILKKNGFALRP
jgi:molybdate transport system substrate-binding protein